MAPELNMGISSMPTAKEHRLFLAPSDQYGRKWTKIAASLQTRMAVQVRRHALKYHAKLEKARKTGADVGHVDAAFSEVPKASGILDEHQMHRATIKASHWKEEEKKLFLILVV